ncbi:transporter substrate-binding domain-containing protein [Streptomyces anulatus]|uniref:transporter substrate-binding domain-containing protein n=1 Tax=Streptomyces anulatus TaxID=1892 RepID=UPI00365A8CA7
MYEEDQETRPLRARKGPVPGGTPAADELAEWLNKIAGGRTAQQMESRFPYGRTQWSDFLKGRKLIPLWLLNSVVTTLVPPQHQQLHLARGHELLGKAERAAAAAAAGKAAASPPARPPAGTAHEYKDHLSNARRGQSMARETVQSLSYLVQLLTGEMQELDHRCKSLEDELDRARRQLQQQQEANATANQQRAAENRKIAAGFQQQIAETEQRLAELEQRHENFEQNLTRAQQGQREAEELRIEAFWQTEENRLAVNQLTGQDTPPEPAEEIPGLLPAPLWGDSHVLEITEAQLDTRMNTIREQIGLPSTTAPEEPRIIRGRVVPGPSADRADKTSTSGKPVHTPPADRADADSGTAGKPSHPTDNERQDHGAAPSANGTGAPQASGRPGRKRRGPRIALIGTACLALLAGGGLTWNQLRERGPGPDAPITSNLPSQAMIALGEAKKAGESEEGSKFLVGVKSRQPGLSENQGTEADPDWVGLEIEYAKKILGELGLSEGQYEFVSVPTEDREKFLEKGKVHIFIGTYGITLERLKGQPDKPPVIFAGPYLTTPQRVILQRHPKHPDKAKINGRDVTVDALTDIPEDADICLVEGSTAEKYIKDEKEKGKFPSLKKPSIKSGYSICIDELKDRYDAVMTDAAILAGFLENSPEDYIIAAFAFGEEEKYGIALGRESHDLRKKVCDAMRRASKDRNDIYRKLTADRKVASVPKKMDHCK